MDEIDSHRVANPSTEMQALLPPLVFRDMKIEVKQELKDQGKDNLFTDERYEFVKSLMKIDYKRNLPLRGYLAIDPAHKVKYIVDHIIKIYQ